MRRPNISRQLSGGGGDAAFGSLMQGIPLVIGEVLE
jgi:hypothetical protein